jgi:hypothetical protein
MCRRRYCDAASTNRRKRSSLKAGDQNLGSRAARLEARAPPWLAVRKRHKMNVGFPTRRQVHQSSAQMSPLERGQRGYVTRPYVVVIA